MGTKLLTLVYVSRVGYCTLYKCVPPWTFILFCCCCYFFFSLSLSFDIIRGINLMSNIFTTLFTTRRGCHLSGVRRRLVDICHHFSTKIRVQKSFGEIKCRMSSVEVQSGCRRQQQHKNCGGAAIT